MSSTTTPQLGLVKPTPGTGESASVAVLNSNSDLIDAEAARISDFLDDAWTSYTPAWSKASGTAPSLGNGTLQGRYKKIGKTVIYEIQFVWGSTTNANGTELWLFSLPAAANQLTNNANGGQFGISDSDGNWHAGTVLITTGSTTLRFRIHGQGSGQSITSTIPMTWASGDLLTINGIYEAA